MSETNYNLIENDNDLESLNKLNNVRKKLMHYITMEKFIDFVKQFKNYSYLIQDNKMYVIINHYKDRYSMGNIFKRIDDEAQYQKFYNNINEVLKVVETVVEYGF